MAASAATDMDIDIDLLSGTPRPGAEVGPACTPVTDDINQAFPGRAAQAFAGGIPTFNMEVDDVELHPQVPRAQHADQVSQASSSIAAASASPPAGAALQWQPAVALVPLEDLGVPSIKAHAVLMFASGAGEAVASGRGISTALSVKGLVLNCGTAILELCLERRSELRRPGGELDKIEMLGWLLGDLLGGRLVSHKEAMAIGTKAGKMVFGKLATLTSTRAGSLGSITKLDNKACSGARLSKLAVDDPRRAEFAAEDAATLAAHLREPVTLPVPTPPKKTKQREPLLSELPATPTSAAALTPAPSPADAPADAPAAAAAADPPADPFADALARLKVIDAEEAAAAAARAEAVTAQAETALAKAAAVEAAAARDAAAQKAADAEALTASLAASLHASGARVAEAEAAWAACARQADIQRRAEEWGQVNAAVKAELLELEAAIEACMSGPECMPQYACLSRRHEELTAYVTWMESEAGGNAWMGLE